MIWYVLASIILSWVLILWSYRREIERCWQEPTLKHPVFIIESDDWGPGPHGDAAALNRVAETLQEFRDRCGRHPMMTLGIVLSVPDGSRMKASSFRQYWRLELDDGSTAAVLDAIRHGIQGGLFSAQLHGHEHFWPPSLMRASCDSFELRDWFSKDSFPRTEELPPHLQSRWVDAVALPSKALEERAIRDALSLEIECFERVFGTKPTVYVPPTFIWTDVVERTLVDVGVEVLVTPGRRCVRHAASGEPEAAETRYFNGQSLASMTVLVRDIYFEPSRGHSADRVIGEVLDHFRLARPALLETHRANFIGNEEERCAALEELRRLLSAITERAPDRRFLSSEELAGAYNQRSAELVERSRLRRLQVLVSRLARISRMRKLAIATGLGVFAWLFVIGVRRGSPALAT